MNHSFELSGSTSLRLVLFLAFLCSMAGCESLEGTQSVFRSSAVDHATEIESHRSRFLESRAPADLQWLLSNVVRSGMPRGEISQILGEAGQLVRDDARFKRNGGHYRENDTIWKWGPDNLGRSVFLAFRSGKLVNFDPDEFAETEPDGTRFIDEPELN